MAINNTSATSAQHQDRTTQYTSHSKFGSNAPNPVKFSFEVNTDNVKNKKFIGDSAKDWKRVDGTADDLANHIKEGHPFMPGLLNETRYRKGDNVVGYQSVAVDVDSDMSLKEALEHPFVRKYCGLIYTSHSHQKWKQKKAKKGQAEGDWIEPCDRYRLLFVLPDPLNDLELWDYLWQEINEKVTGYDVSCKNKDRMFYGSTETEIILCDSYKTVDEEVIANAKDRQAIAKAVKTDRQISKPEYDYDPAKTRELVEEALTYIPQRNPGSGNYHECLRVLMALESEFGDEGIDIAESWSPSIPGDTWQIPYKFKSFKRHGGNTVTIGTLFHIAEQYGFEMPRKPTGKGVKSKSKETENNQQWDYDSVKKHIQNLIDEGFSESQIKLELDRLSKESGFHQISLKDVYWELLEVDKTLSKIKNQNKEIERLERLRAKNLDIDKLLDSKNLTNQLKIKAKRLGVTPESFLVILLVTAGSLINIDTCLQIIPNDNWKARPILWAVLIALSGRGKSPVIDEITEPLNEFQAELDEKFEKDYENYEKELEEYEDGNRDEKPKEPTYPSVIYNNATTESLVKGLKDNPGKIAFQKLDELDELFKGANQYKGGAGADIQFYLQMTRGKPYKVDRAGKGKPTFIKKAGVSIVGGIQPKVARQTFQGQHADNGFLPRFLPYEIPKGKKDRGDTSVKIDISPLLKSCYERLYFMESKFFTMSSDAWEIYDKWLEWLDNENYKLSDDDGAYASFLSKMGENTASITLVLHCLNAALRGEEPEEKLDAETIKKGIEIAQFFIAQFSILNAGLKSDDLASSDSAKPQDEIIKLSRDKGWIKAKDCQNSGRAALKGLKPDVIRSLFQELANAGKGETRDKETRLQFKAFSDDDHDTGCDNKTPEEAVGSVGSGSVAVGSNNLPVEGNNDGGFENSSSVVGSYPPSSFSQPYQSEKVNGDKTTNKSGSSSSSYSLEETLLPYQMAGTQSESQTEPVGSEHYQEPTEPTTLPVEETNPTKPQESKLQCVIRSDWERKQIIEDLAEGLALVSKDGFLKLEHPQIKKGCVKTVIYQKQFWDLVDVIDSISIKLKHQKTGAIETAHLDFCRPLLYASTKFKVGDKIWDILCQTRLEEEVGGIGYGEVLEVDKSDKDNLKLKVFYPDFNLTVWRKATYRNDKGNLQFTVVPAEYSKRWELSRVDIFQTISNAVLLASFPVKFKDFLEYFLKKHDQKIKRGRENSTDEF